VIRQLALDGVDELEVQFEVAVEMCSRGETCPTPS
jgi:hypothetical protein